MSTGSVGHLPPGEPRNRKENCQLLNLSSQVYICGKDIIIVLKHNVSILKE